MGFNFGVTYNCSYGSESNWEGDIGGGNSGGASLAYLSNDLAAIERELAGPGEYGETYKLVTQHALVGKHVTGEPIGHGRIVAVLVAESDEDVIIAVVFENPSVSVLD